MKSLLRDREEGGARSSQPACKWPPCDAIPDVGCRRMRFVIAIAMLGMATACTDDVDELQVTVDTGVVHGTKTGTVRQFLGIPYAEQPLGDLRWRAPQPAPKWTGVLPANA